MHLGIFSFKLVFGLVVMDKVLKISFFVEFWQKYTFWNKFYSSFIL